MLYSYSSLLFPICIALKSCYHVLSQSFPSLSFPSPFIQKKSCTHYFQLQSITLQLVDLLKITAIRPELSFVSPGAELIGAPCPERVKQCKLRFHLCCYFYFLAPVLMSLPAFLPCSVSSPLSENEAKY